MFVSILIVAIAATIEGTNEDMPLPLTRGCRPFMAGLYKGIERIVNMQTILLLQLCRKCCRTAYGAADVIAAVHRLDDDIVRHLAAIDMDKG